MNAETDQYQPELEELQRTFISGNYDSVISDARRLLRVYQSGTAYNLLALAHKKKGDYSKAKSIYEELLKRNPDNTMFLTNLGNLNFDIGCLRAAETCLKKSLSIDPSQDNTAISLANLYVTQLRFDNALNILSNLKDNAPALSVSVVSDINFRIAEIYRKKGTRYFDLAIDHYRMSDNSLSSGNMLECIYTSRDRYFYEKEKENINNLGHCNPLLAAVQTHASLFYETPDTNLFCTNPFQHIRHSRLDVEEGFDSSLAKELIELADTFEATPQSLINHGKQTAGNIFTSQNPAILKIKKIIMANVRSYREEFAGDSSGFISSWPENSSLHGWFVNISSGGTLDAHMHKQGWISGSLYLSIDKSLDPSEGNLVFSLQGPDYPKLIKPPMEIEVDLAEGDLVLFPSSIFHRTNAFVSTVPRISLAFDLKPDLR